MSPNRICLVCLCITPLASCPTCKAITYSLPQLRRRFQRLTAAAQRAKQAGQRLKEAEGEKANVTN